MTQLSFIINIALAWEFAKRYNDQPQTRELFIVAQCLRNVDKLTPQAKIIAETLIKGYGKKTTGPCNPGTPLTEFYFDTYLALAVDGVDNLPHDATPIDVSWYESLINKSALPKVVSIR